MNLSSARDGIAVASLDDYVYFAGGHEANGSVVNFVDVLYTIDGSFSRLELPTGRAFMGAAAAGTKVVFAGGATTNNLTSCGLVIDVYDTANQTWTSDTLLEVRCYPQVVAVGTQIIILGGLDQFGEPALGMVVYDVSTGTFESLSQPSFPRANMGSASSGSKAYFVGGRGANGIIQTQIDVYDGTTWMTNDALSSARGGVTVVAVGANDFLIAGGLDASAVVTAKVDGLGPLFIETPTPFPGSTPTPFPGVTPTPPRPTPAPRPTPTPFTGSTPTPFSGVTPTPFPGSTPTPFPGVTPTPPPRPTPAPRPTPTPTPGVTPTPTPVPECFTNVTECRLDFTANVLLWNNQTTPFTTRCNDWDAYLACLVGCEITLNTVRAECRFRPSFLPDVCTCGGSLRFIPAFRLIAMMRNYSQAISEYLDAATGITSVGTFNYSVAESTMTIPFAYESTVSPINDILSNFKTFLSIFFKQPIASFTFDQGKTKRRADATDYVLLIRTLPPAAPSPTPTPTPPVTPTPTPVPPACPSNISNCFDNFKAANTWTRDTTFTTKCGVWSALLECLAPCDSSLSQAQANCKATPLVSELCDCGSGKGYPDGPRLTEIMSAFPDVLRAKLLAITGMYTVEEPDFSGASLSLIFEFEDELTNSEAIIATTKTFLAEYFFQPESSFNLGSKRKREIQGFEIAIEVTPPEAPPAPEPEPVPAPDAGSSSGLITSLGFLLVVLLLNLC